MFPSLSLIIPCYNERKRVDYLFNGLDAFAEMYKGDWEAVLIDDGSSDGTYDAIKKHKSFSDKIKIVRQQNSGKGGALKTGVALAKKDFVLTLDADMATQPSEIMNWLKIKGDFSKNEILIASREHSESVVNDKTNRRFIGRWFNFLVRKISGLKVMDTQCGFKLYPTSIAQELFHELQTEGWAHDVELLCRASLKNIPFKEMPICWNYIEGSKINVVKDSVVMLREILQIKRMLT